LGKVIDIRSDTVTKPTPAMLEAMIKANVGDDVYEEDISTNELQEKCAALSGKESAIFVTSGVLGNQLAIKCHTDPGDEVIVESESHILNYETAAPSVISNVQLLPVPGVNGIMTASDIEKKIRSKEYYFPVTKLICLENTHNSAGGVIIPIDILKEISEMAGKHNIKTHLDGARIFNASAETGISLKEYAENFDSVSFCFSKGLGCPVGSILCGSRELIDKARKWRKILGGGMRQSGILAAAATFALDNNIKRLKEDHAKAKLFAEKIKNIDSVSIDLSLVMTNIVVFSVQGISKADVLAKAKEKGVILSSGSYENIRAVFHLDVSMEETKTAAEILGDIL